LQHHHQVLLPFAPSLQPPGATRHGCRPELIRQPAWLAPGGGAATGVGTGAGSGSPAPHRVHPACCPTTRRVGPGACWRARRLRRRVRAPRKAEGAVSSPPSCSMCCCPSRRSASPLEGSASAVRSEGSTGVVQLVGRGALRSPRAAGTHYRKKDLCRVSSVLPSVFFGHSAKRHSAKFLTLGKEPLCRVPFLDTRQRVPLPSVFLEHWVMIIFKSYFEVVN
jgi:hypothetical protein